MRPEVLTEPPSLRHVSVAYIPSSSGGERERVHTESWDATGGSEDVCLTRTISHQWRHSFQCEHTLSLPDDGGRCATETCRSEGDPQRISGHIG
jgi:hypothetical protein